jgi:hypothetical protein
MADIFGENNEENKVPLGLNDLVGEGKKYSDPDQLANAYANVESFAEQLKRENAELRAFKDAEEARSKNQQPPVDNGAEPVPGGDNRQEPPKTPSQGDNDFRSQIREEVKALNEQERGLANLDTAAKRLIEIEGSEAKANEAIRRRASELGVTVDWMKETAMRSPQAFYTSMGIAAGERSTSTPAPNPDVKFRDNGNLRNFEFFDKMRKENPKLYFDRSTQAEMMAEARRQGADFYKR